MARVVSQPGDLIGYDANTTDKTWYWAVLEDGWVARFEWRTDGGLNNVEVYMVSRYHGYNNHHLVHRKGDAS